MIDKVVIDKAMSGSIKDLERICNIAQLSVTTSTVQHSETMSGNHLSTITTPEKLLTILPVFYHHLDPARIPDVVTSKDVRDIILAKHSLRGVICTLQHVAVAKISSQTSQTISNYLISNWHRCDPWINFFYSHFFTSRSRNPAHILISRSETLHLVVDMLVRMGTVGDSQTPQSLINTPSLHSIILQLWCMAVASKDNDFLV